MNLWMRFGQPMENVMNDYARIFDAWQEGGVTGIVVGRMYFDDASAAFDPNPETYHRFGVESPNPPAESHPEKRALLHKMLDDAKARGWDIWIFAADSGRGKGGTGHIFADAQNRAAHCARIADTLDHFSQADGAIMDGPEWGYEIHPHHRSNIFNDLPESVAPLAAQLGFDYAALVAAKDRFHQTLRSLDATRNTQHATRGFFGAFALFGADPDLMAWFKFRVDALTNFFRNVRQDMNAHAPRPIKLGLGPRSACFAPLCGYDFMQLADIVDVLLPKHYFWHRGFDGMYGTVYRYVEALTEWNDSFNDDDALQVVRALFGLELPLNTTFPVADRSDFENGFSDEFFETVVFNETHRAMMAMGADEHRVVPWVDTGRSPHSGDPMTAYDLKRILIASQQIGLQRFLYHNHGHLTPGEWVVMSEMCGKRWEEHASRYRPPDGQYEPPR
jgi:hypothetical protein